jgi:hypothetical protein
MPNISSDHAPAPRNVYSGGICKPRAGRIATPLRLYTTVHHADQPEGQGRGVKRRPEPIATMNFTPKKSSQGTDGLG